MYSFRNWEEQLNTLYRTYCNVCASGDVEYEQDIPATHDEIAALEKDLKTPVPKGLRNTFLSMSGNIYFSAYLPDDFTLPDELSEIFSACFTISLEEMLEAENSRKAWVEGCFSNPEDEYDKVWHNKLGFMTVPNGDIIAFDLDDPKEDKRVVYLSHDDSENHGVILGETFGDYFQSLLLIGGCGNEDWQMAPFIDTETGLDSGSANAETYRKLIGLKI